MNIAAAKRWDMEKQVGLTEARGKLSDIVNEVMYQQDTYVISKQGKPAVAVVPVSVWEQWKEDNKPQPRKKLATIIEELRAESADSPAAQMDDDEFMETINKLVYEVRAQMKAEKLQV
jgi:prevent-host-death family protein